jgi:hypothetical protein
LQGVRFDPVTGEGRDAFIEQRPKRLSVWQLGKLSEFDPLLVSQAFGLVNKMEVRVIFECKNVNLKTLGDAKLKVTVRT